MCSEASKTFATIPLDRFLKEGETVAHFTTTETYYAVYKRGYLVPHNDKTKKFESLTNFCNSHSKSKLNGWKVCQVYRDGLWIKMEDLKNGVSGSSSSSKVVDPKIKVGEEVEEMPPKKTSKEKTPQKAMGTPKKLGTIIASIVEDESPAIEVSSFIRIRLNPTVIAGKRYWLNSTSGKVYDIAEKDGVGPYKGKLDKLSMKIDESAVDSDME